MVLALGGGCGCVRERMGGSAEQKSTTCLFLLFQIAKSDVAARTSRRVAFGANFLVRFFEMDHGSSTTEY